MQKAIKKPANYLTPDAPTTAPAPIPTPAPTAQPDSTTNDLLVRQLLQPPQVPAASNLLLQLLLGQQLNLGHQFLQPNPIPPPSAPVITPSIQSPTPSPVKALPRYVPLEEFCLHYHITPETQEKLRKLDIIPGDVKGIESLERCDWSGDAGFSRIAWDRFRETHKAFMVDVRNGIFDT